MPPRSKKADSAAPTSPPTETVSNKPGALTEDQFRAYANGILLHHADQEEGEVPTPALVKWANGTHDTWHPEVLDQLCTDKLLVIEGPLTVLTALGWRKVVRIRDELATAALARRDDELKAHREYTAKEQQILSVIRSRESGVESARGALQMAKEALKEAHEELAAHCAGGVQTSFLDNKDKMAKAPAKEDPIAADWAKILPPVTPDRVKVAPGKGLPDQATVIAAVVQPIVFEAEKRKLDKTLVLTAWDTPFIVSALWHEKGESRANLLRLFTRDEWAQTHEAEFGRAVDGFDQTDEAKAMRQKGGAWCGMVLRVGNKPYVVGPQSYALHLVHPAPAVEPESPPADGKSAAAGEDPKDSEDDEHDANGDD